jgi:hypothetical protein
MAAKQKSAERQSSRLDGVAVTGAWIACLVEDRMFERMIQGVFSSNPQF